MIRISFSEVVVAVVVIVAVIGVVVIVDLSISKP